MKISSQISENNNHSTEDTSEYLISGDADRYLDFDNLASSHFTNIVPIYTSESNPTVIYSATRYGKRFILKGLTENFRDDPIQNMALLKEFEIGMSLDHTNIRRTIGFEKVEGLGPIIILEYVDGQSLDKILDTNRINSYFARTVVNQIASALKYIHNKQIFHRDLKLSNILISHHGLYAKIIDFNLSDSESFVILKNPGGSEKYMAPEQKLGTSRPSVVADIFSFGIIIKELAAASNDTALMRVAERCTNRNPDKRPQSVEEITLPKPDHSPGSLISKILYSNILTYIAGIICILLTLVIIYILFTKHIL